MMLSSLPCQRRLWNALAVVATAPPAMPPLLDAVPRPSRPRMLRNAGLARIARHASAGQCVALDASLTRLAAPAPVAAASAQRRPLHGALNYDALVENCIAARYFEWARTAQLPLAEPAPMALPPPAAMPSFPRGAELAVAVEPATAATVRSSLRDSTAAVAGRLLRRQPAAAAGAEQLQVVFEAPPTMRGPWALAEPALAALCSEELLPVRRPAAPKVRGVQMGRGSRAAALDMPCPPSAHRGAGWCRTHTFGAGLAASVLFTLPQSPSPAPSSLLAQPKLAHELQLKHDMAAEEEH